MAAFEESEVTAAVAEILPELDDDTKAYVVSMMSEPGSDIDDMKEMVAGLIVSFGVVEEEDGAAALVTQLLDKLQIDGSAGAAEVSPGGGGRRRRWPCHAPTVRPCNHATM